jgi:hypothetical protein
MIEDAWYRHDHAPPSRDRCEVRLNALAKAIHLSLGSIMER